MPRREVLKQLLLGENTLPGFNDSGAHLTNMAFFDGNLRTLQLAQEDGLETVARQVRRLTREPAALFNLDVGTLDLGAQADVILIDPAALKAYDAEAATVMQQNADRTQLLGLGRQALHPGLRAPAAGPGSDAGRDDPTRSR